MPIVHEDFREGVGEDKVKTMMRGITNVTVEGHPWEEKLNQLSFYPHD